MKPMHRFIDLLEALILMAILPFTVSAAQVVIDFEDLMTGGVGEIFKCFMPRQALQSVP